MSNNIFPRALAIAAVAVAACAAAVGATGGALPRTPSPATGDVMTDALIDYYFGIRIKSVYFRTFDGVKYLCFEADRKIDESMNQILNVYIAQLSEYRPSEWPVYYNCAAFRDGVYVLPYTTLVEAKGVYMYIGCTKVFDKGHNDHYNVKMINGEWMCGLDPYNEDIWTPVLDYREGVNMADIVVTEKAINLTVNIHPLFNKTYKVMKSNDLETWYEAGTNTFTGKFFKIVEVAE